MARIAALRDGSGTVDDGSIERSPWDTVIAGGTDQGNDKRGERKCRADAARTSTRLIAAGKSGAQARSRAPEEG